MRQKIKKNLVGILLAIIGSFLYSRIIDPNLDTSITFMGGLFASLSETYLDYLYDNVGDGVKEIFSYYTYAAIYGVFIMLIIILFAATLQSAIKEIFNIQADKDNSESKELEKVPDKKKYIISLVFGTLLSISVFLFMMSTVIKHHYTYNVIVYIEKSIDIIAPEINEQERLILRANYRRIDSYDTYNQFNENLQKLAAEKKVSLPEFKMIMK